MDKRPNITANDVKEGSCKAELSSGRGNHGPQVTPDRHQVTGKTKTRNRHQDRNVECSDHATEGKVGKHQERDGKNRDKYFGIERSEMEGSWENTI
ncbi:hypothetical protein ElyMa_002257000 [Elysia marginata]|uniref:Uncharacterized protein n=1 Tax=Elysia marginata TaxID=1093978 RepID=A0AAV4G161_9GAST|nr:hypothetical protein ElyMa_002257000 [Elysia marginata]